MDMAAHVNYVQSGKVVQAAVFVATEFRARPPAWEFSAKEALSERPAILRAHTGGGSSGRLHGST